MNSTLRTTLVRITPALLGAVLLTLGFANDANAESVQWTTHVPSLAAEMPYGCEPRILDAGATITYAATAIDTATGANICGSTILKGTMVRFEFTPHTYEHVYWYGTGFFSDTPYGDWTPGAAAPPAGETCQAKNLYSTMAISSGSGEYDFYGTLAVAPPAKSVTGLSQFSCGSSAPDGSVSCVAQTAGSATPAFDFAPTHGQFYAEHFPQNQCEPTSLPLLHTYGEASNLGGGRGWYSCTAMAPYTMMVPQQSISCPIIVIDANGNHPPATPTLSSAGLCTVGSPHAINMTSTDPDNDNLKYGIDWDANGVVDQYVPGSGFVPSGSTQTVSRTYAIAGSKTVKVLAQDASGNTSSWASISFSCAGSTTAGLNEGDTKAGSGTGGTGGLALLPDLDLRVIPSLVKSGNTTKVNWSSDNVRSCSVAGENGDNWSGLLSPLGGLTSQPITGETTYTLSCLALDGSRLTKSATVRIIPTFQEI